MAATWSSINGVWCLLIPVVEEHGLGTYDVEHRDGTSREVIVTRVAYDKTRKRFDGTLCYLGITERQQQDRSARVHTLNHVPDDPHRIRLNKARDEVTLPESVAMAAVRKVEPVEVDGLKVWLDTDHWSPAYCVDGVRMVHAPIEAAMAS